MNGNQKRLIDLQIRRQQLAASRRDEELRKTHGAKLVDQLNQALGLALSLDDFKADAAILDRFIWPKNLQDAPGFVVAYQERPNAVTLLSSIERALPSLAGKVGFHGKDYLGLAPVSGVRASQLLMAAEAAEDSVLLLVERPAGAMLVDYYRTPGRGPFSVVAQGTQLMEALKACFAPLAQRPET
jgi:hypothetical protein